MVRWLNIGIMRKGKYKGILKKDTLHPESLSKSKGFLVKSIIKGNNDKLVDKEVEEMLVRLSSNSYDNTTRIFSLLELYSLFGRMEGLKTGLKIAEETIIKNHEYDVLEELWEITKGDKKIRDILILFFGVGFSEWTKIILKANLRKGSTLKEIINIDIKDWVNKGGLENISSDEMRVIYRVIKPKPQFKLKFKPSINSQVKIDLLSLVISIIETYILHTLIRSNSIGASYRYYLLFNLINSNVMEFLRWKNNERKFIKGNINVVIDDLISNSIL